MNTKTNPGLKPVLWRYTLVSLFCALFLYACDFPGTPPNGHYLTVNFPGASGARNARSVLSDDNINSLVYKVTFTGPGGTVIEQTVESGSISLALEAGEWVIAAKAYEYDDFTIGAWVGTGTVTVTVIPGQAQSVAIPMYVTLAYESTLDVIFIHNEAELRRIGAAVGGLPITSGRTFYLENDIVLTQPWTPIGDGTPSFAAVFNGNGHTITINSFSSTAMSDDNLGLFGKTDGANIKNLTIVYPNLEVNATPSYDSYVGGLAGQAVATIIDNVHVKGVIACTSSPTDNLLIGGLVGLANTGSSISNSSFSGTLTGEGGRVYAGGIAGESFGPINTSYAAGTINVTPNSVYVSVGGIVGQGTPNIENCYSAVTVTGTETPDNAYAGGIIGTLTSGSVRKCYALGSVTVTGSNIGAGGIAGRSSDTIENCAALAHVNGGSSNTVGRVIGNNAGSVADNYAAPDRTFINGGTPTGEDGDDTTYTTIGDFEGAGKQSTYETVWGTGTFGVPGGWKWISGYDYPVLSWQTAAP
jgi:hypothetical protein